MPSMVILAASVFEISCG